MCGRATLSKSKSTLEKRFRAKFSPMDEDQNIVNYNVAPTQLHPVITNENPQQIQLFKWGLIPFWAKDSKIGSKMINSRIETITEKPSFRTAIKRRRCLVLLDGFYEWKKLGNRKQPYYIHLKNKEAFALAGIWEKWKHPENGKPIYSFSIITQSPNNFMAQIHNRMPAILLKEDEQKWLDINLSADETLSSIRPLDDDLLEAYPISNQVNRVSENTPELLNPISPDQA
jgi:Uncharacterized conserved protein